MLGRGDAEVSHRRRRNGRRNSGAVALPFGTAAVPVFASQSPQLPPQPSSSHWRPSHSAHSGIRPHRCTSPAPCRSCFRIALAVGLAVGDAASACTFCRPQTSLATPGLLACHSGRKSSYVSFKERDNSQNHAWSRGDNLQIQLPTVWTRRADLGDWQIDSFLICVRCVYRASSADPRRHEDARS
jgi:hypothetical protein